MSIESRLEAGGEDGLEARKTERGGGVDGDEVRTPRPEVPIAVKVLSPSASTGSLHSISGQDYFNLSPAPAAANQLPALTRSTSVTPAPTAVTGASDVVATGHLQLPSATSSLLSPERPSPHSHVSSLSIGSTDSVATITAATSIPANASTAAQRRPAFPNQSYAALHSQQYPVRRHPPPVLRQRSSHPGQILTFTSALASLHQTGTRTVGHSPAVTPGAGLYTPTTAPPTEDYESPETPGTYASPFLHFTQRQAPKETHVADVDVDPVSGRKLINHYEIMDELGRGTHGKVKLGRDLHTEDTHVAIKIVERYSKRRKLGKLVSAAEDKVKKEVAILKKVRHPNIVALLEVIDDPTRKKVYIVLEYVHRGEIHWRTHTSKEIAMVEARRYERERSGRHDARAVAESEALVLEAQRRLAKERRRQARAHRDVVRRMGLEDDDNHHFSLETGGDDLSEESEEDRSSRISSSTAYDTTPARLFGEGRRGSRAYSPLPPRSLVASTIAEGQPAYLSLASEPQAISPTAGTQENASTYNTRLAGSMYGPYVMSSTESSRNNSLANSEEHIDLVELSQLAKDIMDSEISPELTYAPVLTLQETRVAFRDTLLGLQYLHYQGIVHRDIKPPNLLQTFDHPVKISDFGVSYLGRPMEEGEASEDVSEHEALDFDEAKELAKTVGTPAFYAPELCIAEPGDDPLPVTKAIDVWALGITLFCMLFARTPFVDNEFVVMRQIADEDIYIPRQRLLPVTGKPASRPSSHGRAFPPRPMGRRQELDIVYEEIDDDLHDLLKRLLTKDPRRRITLEEVRHHPWLVADLPNKVKWLEETESGRQSHGKRIEVSNEDVKTAVIPLQFLDRVRSGIKKVTDRLGFGSGKPLSSGRGRTGSSAGLGGNGSNADSPAASASSSSSTLNHDQRRQSLHGAAGEDIYSALRASRQGERQGEHPLSRSVAASPEIERQTGFFDRPSPSQDGEEETASELKLHPSPSRPYMPERSKTYMSTADSIRTLKQADVRRGRESPPPSPGLPGTPVALESPGGHALQTILGSGAARRALKGFRREGSAPRAGGDLLGRNVSRDRESASAASIDAHGEPTLALSQTSAEGLVNLPQALLEMGEGRGEGYPGSIQSSRQNSPQNSRQTSPVASRSHSVVSLAASTSARELHLLPRPAAPPAGRLSRNSSGASVRSVNVAELSRRSHHHHPPLTSNESSAADWRRADEERVRKLIREGREEEEEEEGRKKGGGRVVSGGGGGGAFEEGRRCPPSPDDDQDHRTTAAAAAAAARQASAFPPGSSHPVSPHETSPTTGPHPHQAQHHHHHHHHHLTQLPPALVSSSSDFGSAVSVSMSMSMSMSNPSIPSVISEASSVDPAERLPLDGGRGGGGGGGEGGEGLLCEEEGKREGSSDSTLDPRGGVRGVHGREDEEGYAPDREEEGAVESDNHEDDGGDGDGDDDEDDDMYDDSSDSDGGLVMTRRKSKTGGNQASAGDMLAAALGERGPMNTAVAVGGNAAESGKERRPSALSARSKKSSRSGSSHTMKKVRTRESEEEERRGGGGLGVGEE
ncbi:hypothetical protein B0A55_03002 [Friedmanniomyces simplex]|uniref:non-specific serine/threonine protein kinase n=1 Tax=Friedmanniomyces simplex TaxID=329884 RepID=A0A4U0XV04_9PEZI|nr:hypothetical protein B0A55_03002 [Friedmanniomyces simplex]